MTSLRSDEYWTVEREEWHVFRFDLTPPHIMKVQLENVRIIWLENVFGAYCLQRSCCFSGWNPPGETDKKVSFIMWICVYFTHPSANEPPENLLTWPQGSQSLPGSLPRSSSLLFHKHLAAVAFSRCRAQHQHWLTECSNWSLSRRSFKLLRICTRLVGGTIINLLLLWSSLS